MTVLDHEGEFETLEEALAARDQARRKSSNPVICVYELVKTPADQTTEDGWGKKNETPTEVPKAPDVDDSEESMAKRLRKPCSKVRTLIWMRMN